MASSSSAPNILATAIAMLVLDTLFVGLRFYSRFVGKRVGLWWDDWTALAALVLTNIMSALTIYWVNLGLGQHFDQVDVPITVHLKTIYIWQFFYAWGIFLVKISAIIFYARIFRIFTGFRIALWVTAGLVVAWILTITFLAAFVCDPPQKSWEPALPGTCIDSFTSYMVNGIPNAITDFIILILPLPMLWQLQMNPQKRLATALMFIASYAVLGISVARTSVVATQSKTYSLDFTYNLTAGVILAILEPGFGILCICLPAIAQLVELGWEQVSSRLSSKPRRGSDEENDIKLTNLTLP